MGEFSLKHFDRLSMPLTPLCTQCENRSLGQEDTSSVPRKSPLGAKSKRRRFSHPRLARLSLHLQPRTGEKTPQSGEMPPVPSEVDESATPWTAHRARSPDVIAGRGCARTGDRVCHSPALCPGQANPLIAPCSLLYKMGWVPWDWGGVDEFRDTGY